MGMPVLLAQRREEQAETVDVHADGELDIVGMAAERVAQHVDEG